MMYTLMLLDFCVTETAAIGGTIHILYTYSSFASERSLSIAGQHLSRSPRWHCNCKCYLFRSFDQVRHACIYSSHVNIQLRCATIPAYNLVITRPETMLSRFQATSERLERSLQSLTDSIAAYNPSTAAADEVVAADDALNENLEQRERIAMAAEVMLLLRFLSSRASTKSSLH